MKPTFTSARTTDYKAPKAVEVIISFSNDRHHVISIPIGGNNDDVAYVLDEAAKRLRGDSHLYEKPA